MHVLELTEQAGAENHLRLRLSTVTTSLKPILSDPAIVILFATIPILHGTSQPHGTLEKRQTPIGIGQGKEHEMNLGTL